MGVWQFYSNSYLASRNDYYNTYGELEVEIESLEDDIKFIMNKLRIMSAGTPKDLYPNAEDGDVLFELNKEFNNIEEWLKDTYVKLGKLNAIAEMTQNYAEDNSISLEVAYKKIIEDNDK